MDRQIPDGCEYNPGRDNQHTPETYRKTLFELMKFSF